VADRKKFVSLVDSVREFGGDVKIFSSLHVSGEQLDQLTGLCAILRLVIRFLGIYSERQTPFLCLWRGRRFIRPRRSDRSKNSYADSLLVRIKHTKISVHLVDRAWTYGTRRAVQILHFNPSSILNAILRFPMQELEDDAEDDDEDEDDSDSDSD
jgi:hypothetical protein